MQRSLQPPQASCGIIPATCSGRGDWGHRVLPRGRVRDSLSGAGEEPESPRCGERGCGFPSALLRLFASLSLSPFSSCLPALPTLFLIPIPSDADLTVQAVLSKGCIQVEKCQD